jgi:MerR family transcriptional regulator, mercuric resistance operon regulatory protein
LTLIYATSCSGYRIKEIFHAPDQSLASGRHADWRVTLAFIRRGRELGFTLDQIRALLNLGGPGKASCAEVREIANHHIEDISAKINDLAKLERLLRKTVAQCSGGKAPDCPVLDILDAQGIKTSRT